MEATNSSPHTGGEFLAQNADGFLGGIFRHDDSDVTIRLEKIMPQDILPGQDTSEVDVASTTSPHRSSHRIETYEELEDPFALESQKIPEIGDPFEGYNRFMYDVNEGFYDYLMEPVARG